MISACRDLKAGAEKISIDSMAVRNPDIIKEGACDMSGAQGDMIREFEKETGLSQ